MSSPSGDVEDREGQAWIRGADDRVWLVVEMRTIGSDEAEVRWRMVPLDEPTSSFADVGKHVLCMGWLGWRRIT